MALLGKTKNYQLGSGNLFIADILPSGLYGPERHLGTITAFNLSVTTESYEYYTSNCGPKVKVVDVTTQTDRSGGFTTDDSTWENVALGLGGDVSKVTNTAATVTTEALADVQIGFHYPLGVTTLKPLGVNSKIEDLVVKMSPGGATLVAGTMTNAGVSPSNADYIADLDRGVIEILGGGTVADDDDLEIDYKVVASTTIRFEAGKNIGGLKKLRFKSCNTSGEQRDAIIPRCNVVPSSEISFKGDEVQSLEFEFEVLEPHNGMPAIIIDGRPA